MDHRHHNYREGGLWSPSQASRQPSCHAIHVVSRPATCNLREPLRNGLRALLRGLCTASKGAMTHDGTWPPWSYIPRYGIMADHLPVSRLTQVFQTRHGTLVGVSCHTQRTFNDSQSETIKRCTADCRPPNDIPDSLSVQGNLTTFYISIIHVSSSRPVIQEHCRASTASNALISALLWIIKGFEGSPPSIRKLSIYTLSNQRYIIHKWPLS